jgi:hypothetical protein
MGQLASTILMVRPAGFAFNKQTAVNNSFQTESEALNHDKVLEEFDAFVQELQEQQVDVIVINDNEKPQKPDAIFPNNWFCTLPNGTLALFPMHAPNRRLERRDEIIAQLKEKLNVTEVQDWTAFEANNLFLESTGSMVIDHDNKMIYACLSPRTDEMLLNKFAAVNGYQAISFIAADQQGRPIYHTNVMMHIGDGYAVVCSECIIDDEERKAVTDLLHSTGHIVITITYDQMNHFAGNMLQVESRTGQKITILSRQACDSLTALQIEALMAHTQLLPVDITTIETTGGGSARCMMAEIFDRHQEVNN